MSDAADRTLLAGIRVLEAATFAAGPTCGAILGDLGADVIHVEEPEQGDPYRLFVSQAWMPIGHDLDFNASWELVNRNKRSLALSLKEDEGVEVLDRLISRTDVFITNMLPKARTRLRIGPERLRDINPRLIYVSITGFGRRGPLSEERGYDFGAFWAATGIMGTFGEALGTPPMQRPGMGDRTLGTLAAGGVGLALYHRERTGTGQLIELSLLHTGMWVLGSDIQRTAAWGEPAPRESREMASNPMWNSYKARDGRWLIVTARPDFDWTRFCAALGLHELVRDSRFATPEGRDKHRRELIPQIEAAFLGRDRDDWREPLEAHGVTWAPVRYATEIVEHEQVRANELFYDAVHPAFGTYRLLRPPIDFDRTPARFTRPAPELGEHSVEILADLGYNADDIARLERARIVATRRGSQT